MAPLCSLSGRWLPPSRYQWPLKLEHFKIDLKSLLPRKVDANVTKNATFWPLPQECNLSTRDSNEGCSRYAERRTWASSRKALFLEVQRSHGCSSAGWRPKDPGQDIKEPPPPSRSLYRLLGGGHWWGNERMLSDRQRCTPSMRTMPPFERETCALSGQRHAFLMNSSKGKKVSAFSELLVHLMDWYRPHTCRVKYVADLMLSRCSEKLV